MYETIAKGLVVILGVWETLLLYVLVALSMKQ